MTATDSSVEPLPSSLLERTETTYLATWDDRYQPFSDLELALRCDYAQLLGRY